MPVERVSRRVARGQPRRDMRASLFARSLPSRDALASSHDGYGRDSVKAAVPAALDGRSEILSYCRVPDAGFANRGVQWAELVGAQNHSLATAPPISCDR